MAISVSSDFASFAWATEHCASSPTFFFDSVQDVFSLKMFASPKLNGVSMVSEWHVKRV